jgi:hypothetical protein
MKYFVDAYGSFAAEESAHDGNAAIALAAIATTTNSFLMLCACLSFAIR